MIFLPGFSTAPEISEISGRGVGLDIAQVAIHRMKGAISVESKPGLGTSFVIRLPMTMAVMQAMMVQAGNQTFAIPLTNLKQIVKIGERDIERVGQEQVIRLRGVVHPLLPLTKLLNILSGLLSAEGWTPVQAKDGLDALEMIPRLPAPPDLVLLDIEMPRMDGFGFISIMRKQKGYEKMPFVVLTSRAGQKHRDKAFEVGATDYLIKPYQDDVLLGLIRKLTHLPARRQS